jgi:hypothetical protein
VLSLDRALVAVVGGRCRGEERVDGIQHLNDHRRVIDAGLRLETAGACQAHVVAFRSLLLSGTDHPRAELVHTSHSFEQRTSGRVRMRGMHIDGREE